MTISFLRTLFLSNTGFKLEYRPSSKSKYFGRIWWLMKNGEMVFALFEISIVYDEKKGGQE